MDLEPTTGDNSKTSKYSSASDGSKMNYEAGDKAGDLSSVLKDLSSDGGKSGWQLPDPLQKFVNKEKYFGDKVDLSKKGSALIDEFFKEFIKATWECIKLKGGGWVIPSGLRSYWFWAIKHLGYNLSTHQKKQKLTYLSSGEGDKVGTTQRTSYLLPLELELEVDGIGGMRYGNSFQSEYLPPKYVNNSLFQATEVNHEVNNSGWYTSLKGKMRYIPLQEAREKMDK
mgnify:CR=1 FL=1